MLFTFWNIRQTAKQYLTKNISYYKLIFTSGFINTQNDFLFFCFFGGFSCAIWILIIIYLRSYKKIVHGKSSVFLIPLKAFKTFLTIHFRRFYIVFSWNFKHSKGLRTFPKSWVFPFKNLHECVLFCTNIHVFSTVSTRTLEPGPPKNMPTKEILPWYTSYKLIKKVP